VSAVEQQSKVSVATWLSLSKGFSHHADDKSDELRKLLAMTSPYGHCLVVFDTSPCSQRLQAQAEKNQVSTLTIQLNFH
jgi:hypothetical protein